MRRLASSFYELGQFTEAENLRSQALELTEETAGDHYPNILPTLHNLSKALHQLGHFQEAEPLMAEVVEGKAKTQGHTQLSFSWLKYMQQQRLGRGN